MKTRMQTKAAAFVSALAVLTILSGFSYLAVRTFLFFISPYHWYEKIVALLLLGAESFILLHGFGYFLNLLHILRHPTPRATLAIEPVAQYPPVAIIVSSYKEPISVVTDTLICFYNLTYPNKHLYFLDDTRYDLPGADTEEMRTYRNRVEKMCERIGVNLFRRIWHGAKAGMINDFLDFIEGREKKGFTFYPFEKQMQKKNGKGKIHHRF